MKDDVHKKPLFYDTNAVLELQSRIFYNKFYLSSKTIEELEHIKTSQNKSDDIKFKARSIVRELHKHLNDGTYEVIVADLMIYDMLGEIDLPESPDNIICATASYTNSQIEPIVFCTGDLLCRLMGETVFGLETVGIDWSKLKSDDEEYKGYKVVQFNTDEEMAHFYSNLDNDLFENDVNEYLIIKDKNGDIVDSFKWNGELYVTLAFKNFKSRMFGNIKPLDDIQKCAFDSINSNEMTVLYGRAGCGKTTIPMSYIFQMLETQKAKKCHIIYHYETLKGAKTLGFEKGSHTEKILNSGALGNILNSKVGDMSFVESMINTGTLDIIPTANIRGVEFGSDDIVFVTEAQNLDVYTLKTIIQRCKTGCKQIYEGDILEQSDINRGQLGIDRMIEVFKGHEKFGCVKLKTNYRNPICELADQM